KSNGVSHVDVAKAFRRPRTSLGQFNCAIARWSIRTQRLKEFVSRLRHLVDRAIEGEFVSLRGLVKAAELADELQRIRADPFVGRRRFEVVQSLNVSTHNIYLSPPLELKPSRAQPAFDYSSFYCPPSST